MEILSDATFKGNLSVEGNLKLEAGRGNKLTFVKRVCGIELCYSDCGGYTSGQFELYNSYAHGLSLHLSSGDVSNRPMGSSSDYRIEINDGNGQYGGNSHIVLYDMTGGIVANLAFPKNGSALQELATTDFVCSAICNSINNLPKSSILRFRNPEIPANCTKFIFVDSTGAPSKIPTTVTDGPASEFFLTQVYEIPSGSTVQMDTGFQPDTVDGWKAFNLLGTVSDHADVIGPKKYIAVVLSDSIRNDSCSSN